MCPHVHTENQLSCPRGAALPPIYGLSNLESTVLWIACPEGHSIYVRLTISFFSSKHAIVFPLSSRVDVCVRGTSTIYSSFLHVCLIRWDCCRLTYSIVKIIGSRFHCWLLVHCAAAASRSTLWSGNQPNDATVNLEGDKVPLSLTQFMWKPVNWWGAKIGSAERLEAWAFLVGEAFSSKLCMCGEWRDPICFCMAKHNECFCIPCGRVDLFCGALAHLG